jgi:hypothetical protein
VIEPTTASMTAVMRTNVPPQSGPARRCGMSASWSTAAGLLADGSAALVVDAHDVAEPVVTDSAARRRRRVPGSEHVQAKRRTGGGHRS